MFLLVRKFEKLFSSSNDGVGVYVPILHDISTHQVDRLKDLLMLLQEKYIFIDPQNFALYLNGEYELENNHILLTFDDGYYSNYLIAKEVLGPLGIKSIFFVSTGFIDSGSRTMQKNFIKHNINEGEYSPDLNVNNLKPMTWENLSELVNIGHTIGAHTINHFRLSEINEDNLLKEEIIVSGNRIDEMLRIKVEHFAFPFGDIGSIDKKALELIRKRYKYIYSAVRGRNSYGTNPFAIRREAMDIGDSYEYNRFVAGGGLSFYYWRARRRLDAMIT